MVSPSAESRVALTVTSSAAIAPPLRAATPITPASVLIESPEAVNTGMVLSTEMLSVARVVVFPALSVTVMVKV